MSLKYRADIDGLRAIAVLSVVFFHAGIGASGGFVGVDIFFVISGFLITTNIKKQLDQGTFSIFSFWEKRIRRILPALFFLVFSVLIAGYFLSLPYHYLITSVSAISIFFFASNIQFYRTTGYFQPNAEENPLLHTWSLSVEEQFYLLIPLLLFGIYYFRKRKFALPALIFITLLSIGFSIYWIEKDPVGTFYLLPTRAWELGVGCIITYIKPFKSKPLKTWGSYLGLMLVFYCVFFFDHETKFPGISALPVILGTALIIVCGLGNENNLYSVNRFLSFRPFVFVGLVSYSFYLWHWPFFAYYRYYHFAQPSNFIGLLFILLSFILSVLSLYLIERPFRSYKILKTRKSVFLFGLISSLILVMSSFGIYSTDGYSKRLSERIKNLDSANGDKYMTNNNPVIYKDQSLWKLGKKKKKPNVLLWGDSHALACLPAFDSVANSLNISIIAGIKGGTAPVVNWEKGNNNKPGSSHSYSNAVYDYIVNNKTENIEHVIFMFYWSIYFTNQKNQYGFNKPKDGFPEAFYSMLENINDKGLKITIFNELPIFNQHIARSTALYKWRNFSNPPLLTENEYEKYNEVYKQFIQKVKHNLTNVKIVNPSHYFFSSHREIEYQDPDSKNLYYKDFSHLTKHGSYKLIPLIEMILNTEKNSDES